MVLPREILSTGAVKVSSRVSLGGIAVFDQGGSIWSHHIGYPVQRRYKS
jgi:hypothetical protein